MISNIDRTARNTNLLNWRNELWLIDHGASLYFHHNWASWERHLSRSFPMIKDHVLLERAEKLDEAAAFMQTQLNETVFKEIVDLIPDDWLEETSDSFTPSQKRDAYVTLLTTKLSKIEVLAKEAKDAR